MQHSKPHPGDHAEIHDHHDTTAERHLAATLAVQQWRGQTVTDAGLYASASSIYRFLIGPLRLHISRGPVRDQNTGDVIHHHERTHHVATILTDAQQVDFSVSETDSKGNPTTSSTLSWSLDDPSVGTLTVSSDTLSANFVSAAPGTANLTVTDNDDPNVTGVEAIQVTAGPAAAITITAGTPTAQ